MICFDFCEYPTLQEAFENAERICPYSLLPRAERAKKIFKEKFNLTVEINPHDTYGVVSVNEEDFTFIMLKWGHNENRCDRTIQ